MRTTRPGPQPLNGVEFKFKAFDYLSLGLHCAIIFKVDIEPLYRL